MRYMCCWMRTKTSARIVLLDARRTTGGSFFICHAASSASNWASVDGVSPSSSKRPRAFACLHVNRWYSSSKRRRELAKVNKGGCPVPFRTTAFPPDDMDIAWCSGCMPAESQANIAMAPTVAPMNAPMTAPSVRSLARAVKLRDIDRVDVLDVASANSGSTSFDADHFLRRGPSARNQRNLQRKFRKIHFCWPQCSATPELTATQSVQQQSRLDALSSVETRPRRPRDRTPAQIFSQLLDGLLLQTHNKSKVSSQAYARAHTHTQCVMHSCSCPRPCPCPCTCTLRIPSAGSRSITLTLILTLD